MKRRDKMAQQTQATGRTVLTDLEKLLYGALEAVYRDIELQNVVGGSDELNILVQQALEETDKVTHPVQ